MPRPALLLALLSACGDARLRIDDPTPTGSTPPGPPPPLALVVDAPADRSFAGDDAVEVVGHTSDAHDVVTVEGRAVEVAADGSFSAPVTFDGDLVVLTVTTTRGDEVLVEHRTVYAGVDPRQTWPGAVPVLVTADGLARLAAPLGAQVDALDLPGTLAALLPPFNVSVFRVDATGGTAAPAEVALVPHEGELFLGVGLPDAELVFEAAVPPLPGVPITLSMDELQLGATLSVAGDAAGVALDVVDTDVALDGPSLDLGGLDLGPLDLVLGLVLGVVEAGLGALLDLVPFADFVLPGGSLQTDALGFPLELSVEGVDVTPDGVSALLGVALGAPAVVAPPALSVDDAPPHTDFLVAVPEGLLGALASSDVLSALDLGTITLPGLLGEVIALPLAQLPGGSALPADRTAMCVTVGLPSGGVGRVRDGLDPVAVLLLPDLGLEVGVSTPTTYCEPWLSAELAISAGLVADGSRLVIDLEVVDGAVRSYATDQAWAEDDVVGGLDGLVGAVSGLLGSSLAIDLADLVDPAVLGGTPTLSSARLRADAPGVVFLGLTVE